VKSSLKFKGLLLSAQLMMCGCVVKGYQGPELSEDQLATVRLKAPSTAFIPIFNLMSEDINNDWYQTKFMDSIRVNGIELNRFNKILIKSGNTNFYAHKKRILNETAIAGTDRVSKGDCSCYEKVNEDKSITKICNRTITTSWDIDVTARNYNCHIAYQVQANKTYEVFIRKGGLTLQDDKSNILINSRCEPSVAFTYKSSTSYPSTEDCRF
jgi:hypothetical protein